MRFLKIIDTYKLTVLFKTIDINLKISYTINIGQFIKVCIEYMQKEENLNGNNTKT